MRTLVLAMFAACTPVAVPRSVPPTTELDHALGGDWVGVLEYRDYSEPPESPKRVRLPTWLTIAPEGDHQRWRYTYDDGPNKTIEETELVTFAGAQYTEQALGKPARVYSVAGRAGVGAFEVRGEGTDNDVASETRLSFSIGRNTIDIVQDTRPKSAGADAPFVFRHAFHFTRAQRPVRGAK